MNMTLKVEATGGKPRAKVNHAACANANTPTAL
jgi:hypothetical protein